MNFPYLGGASEINKENKLFIYSLSINQLLLLLLFVLINMLEFYQQNVNYV